MLPGCNRRAAPRRHPDRCCTCGRCRLAGSCTDPRPGHSSHPATQGQSRGRPRNQPPADPTDQEDRALKEKVDCCYLHLSKVPSPIRI